MQQAGSTLAGSSHSNSVAPEPRHDAYLFISFATGWICIFFFSKGCGNRRGGSDGLVCNLKPQTNCTVISLQLLSGQEGRDGGVQKE